MADERPRSYECEDPICAKVEDDNCGSCKSCLGWKIVCLEKDNAQLLVAVEFGETIMDENAALRVRVNDAKTLVGDALAVNWFDGRTSKWEGKAMRWMRGEARETA